MNVKHTVEQFKDKLMCSLDKWIDVKVDEFARNNPKMAMASTYIKRGAHNYLTKEAENIDEMIDNAVLFIADENGCIDTNMVMNDLLTMFKQMDEFPYSLGFVDGTIGKGLVRVHLPENFLTSFLFGDSAAIRITADDVAHLVQMMRS